MCALLLLGLVPAARSQAGDAVVSPAPSLADTMRALPSASLGYGNVMIAVSPERCLPRTLCAAGDDPVQTLNGIAQYFAAPTATSTAAK